MTLGPIRLSSLDVLNVQFVGINGVLLHGVGTLASPLVGVYEGSISVGAGVVLRGVGTLASPLVGVLA